MNILLLSDLDAGGEWIATQTLIEEVKRLKPAINFYIIAKSINSQPRLFKSSFFTYTDLFQPRTYSKPLKYYRQLFSEINTFGKKINHILRKSKIDHVISTFYPASLGYIIFQKNLNFIFFSHGIKNRFPIFWQNLSHFMIFNKVLERLTWILAKKIFAPSTSLLPYLPKDKVSLVPNLIRKEFLTTKKIKRSENLIIYSGRLAEGKGIYQLTSAFMKLQKDYKKLRLLFCYQENQTLEEFRFIKKYTHSKNVFFKKNLTGRQLNRLYQQAALAVLPSEFEIASLFYLEAIASGLPIIVPLLGEIVTWSKIYNINCELILQDLSSQGIYFKIDAFFKNRAVYTNQSALAKEKFAKLYRPDLAVKKFISLLKNA